MARGVLLEVFAEYIVEIRVSVLELAGFFEEGFGGDGEEFGGVGGTVFVEDGFSVVLHVVQEPGVLF